QHVKDKVVVRVDRDGLQQRIAALPIPASSYGQLASAGEQLFYVRKGKLALFDFAKEKETELGDFSSFRLSANRKKMLVRSGDSFGIIDLPSARIELKERLDLGDLTVQLDRQAEWKQMFHECWRQMRDFFYAPNMHGVDWPGVRKKYETLLPYVNHRNDLTFIIGEMIGEINVGHAYVGGGERPPVKKIPLGLLGAEISRDAASQYFKIDKILKGENWNKQTRAPLTEIGVNVNAGDYILAVNGQPTNEMANIYEALVNTVNKQVVLKVNSKPTEQGSREVTVIPTDDEADLYYYNWVQSNIDKVSKATNGKVGYIHVPDMGTPGLNEFVKHFYPQLRKKALIIDVRGNGGGNVSPMLIERLRREIAMIDIARNTSKNPDPGDMMMGPMVCLLNEYSASDGDLFPYRFRKYKLGKLIGKRSWGGVVGIRGTLPFVDGGFLNKPEFASYDTEGKTWIIEGHGVDPDIVVDNDPFKEMAGVDEQLNKAIEVILEELKTQGKELPEAPEYPKK
ncbi:PDZ domain-containing protein, partial [bacterium]|nr:PDZ domain-containing protein [bacterium]